HARASATLEQRDGLDMPGMREHVHHAGGDEAETMTLDQRPRIARERGRMAGNVHDVVAALARQVVEHRRRARTWRIEQKLVPVCASPWCIALVGGEIGRKELDVADAVARGVLARARDQRRLALDARDPTGAT